jgi:hypothetical protein
MSVRAKRVRRDQYSAAVYGSILVAALVGAMFEEHASARTMTLSLAGTVVVFWIAHAWSEVVGERVAQGRLFDSARIKAISLEEWPLVEAGMLPSVLLALAWIGLISRHAAVVIALGVSIIQLVAWGVVAGRRTQPTWPGALTVGAVDGVLGIGIVVLEIAVHR